MSKTSRIDTLLTILPYFRTHPSTSLSEAAEALGTTPETLKTDLNLLFLCGLPGYGPGDLVDISIEGESVIITHDAGLDRPLRLTPAEALSLLVAVHALEATPGAAHSDVLSRVRSKLENVAGKEITATAAQNITVEHFAHRETASILHAAMERGHAVKITYYSASRDAVTQRIIDPITTEVLDGVAYVHAWCRSSRAVRVFRLDRMDAIQELDEESMPPSSALDAPLSALPELSTDAPLVELLLNPEAAWITREYPIETHEENIDGTHHVSLRASSLPWARRLVLSLAPHVTVIGPAELAEDVQSSATEALAQYG